MGSGCGNSQERREDNLYNAEVRNACRCGESALEGSENCIFHAETKDVAKFEEGIRAKLKKKDYYFAGYCFPEQAIFYGITFEGPVDFCGARFNKEADFIGATFRGPASFNQSYFEASANFAMATFEDRASFEERTFQKSANFGGAIFQKDVSFKGATFRGDAILATATFNGIADFTETTFEGFAKHGGATFEADVDFSRAAFQKPVFFIDATFAADSWFTGATFEEDAYFTDATFKGRSDLPRVNIHGIIDFDRARFTRSALKEIAFRVSKISYQEQGQYDKAGDCYYEERVARWETLEWLPGGWSFVKKLAELVFLRGSCGYGERPSWAIGWALGIVILFAGLYYQVGHIASIIPGQALGFGDAIYFSGVTFVTLGFGGPWYPCPNHWIKYFVMFEAFLGSFFLALFVMTFGRRMMR